MYKKILYFSITLFSIGKLNAQSVGSVSTYGGASAVKSIASGGTSADVSETLYIGPGTHTIEGTWEIYARQIVIDPSAVITGGGVIDYYNPSIAGGASSITLVDGNATSSSLDVDMQLQNSSGMQLSEMVFPVSHTSAGWANNTSASTMYVGRNLFLSTDGADITLGSGTLGDLRFDNDAGIFNYRPSRMIITNNSILSHVVKENYTSAFVFPIGIADGDYTPAQVANTSNVTVSASVQDYIASLADEATADPGPGGFLADGIRRTWHIYGDAAGTGSTINLQHNLTTNQSGFTDASHFITQWSATAPNTTGDNAILYSTSAWQSNTLGAGAVGTLITPSGVLGGTSMRSRLYSALATSALSEESYFTKSSDPSHPLPLNFMSNAVSSKQCDIEIKWSASAEDPIEAYNIKHSVNGRDYKSIARIRPALGNDNSYIDFNPDQGDNFYFIEILFVDGTIQRSSTMKATADCASTIKTYPNPAQHAIYIDNLGKGAYTFNIYAHDGKLMLQEQVEDPSTHFTLDISKLHMGHYFLKILSDSKEIKYISIIKE